MKSYYSDVQHYQSLLRKYYLQELEHGVIVTWPCSSVVPEPMILPSLSTISTCVLGSVVTEVVSMFTPFQRYLSKVGAFGGVVSVALTGSDVELLGTSASSVALTVTLPSGIGFVGVMKA